MKITEIHLKNFRQYRNLDLAFNPDDNLIVIVGKNGVGKTNLLNSISWCLFGQENKRKAYNSEALGLPNLLAVTEGNGKAEVRVEVFLRFDDGVEAVVRRSQSFVRSESGNIGGSPSTQKVLVKRPGGGGFEEVDAAKFISQRTPSRLESFFLFDGEKLDEYFQTSNSESVKTAVLQVAQIDILDRLILRLANSRKSLIEQIPTGGASTDIKAMQDAILKNEVILGELQSELAALHKSIDEAEGQYSDIEDTIRRVSAEQDKFDKRTELLARIATLEERHKAEIEALAINAAIVAPYAFNSRVIDSFLDEVARRRDKKELPSSISPQTIQFVLEELVCICGTDLHTNHAAVEHLSHLLAQHEDVSKLGAALVSIEGSMLRLKDRADEFRRVADAKLEEISAIRREFKDADDMRIAIESEIQNSGTRSAPEYLLQLRQTKGTIESTRTRLALLKSDIEAKEKEIQDLESKLTKLLDKDAKNQTISTQILFATDCLDAAQLMRAEITRSTVQDVSDAFRKVYNELIWKDFEADASIDDNFNVRVEKDGHDHFGSLSSGEYECLAFAFSIGLGKVSNYELPMVVDTPLARLSQAVQEKVCETLERVASGKGFADSQQVVLLVTDTEYNPAVQAKLAIGNPAIFEIAFDVIDNVSNIVRT